MNFAKEKKFKNNRLLEILNKVDLKKILHIIKFF